MGEMERITAAIRGGNTRSPLYRWMRRNHDGLVAALEGERPDWKVLTAEFAAMGLVADGTRPEAVRHLWWRVRKATEKARAKRPRIAPPRSAPEMTGHDPLAALKAEMAKRSGRNG